MQGKLICFIVAETARIRKSVAEVTPSAALKSAPHYFEKTVPRQYIINQEHLTLDDHEGTLLLKKYEPAIMLAELTLDNINVFGEEVDSLKSSALTKCREALVQYDGKEAEEFSEEYSVFIVSSYEGSPEQLLQHHKEKVAGLLKSEKQPLDVLEVDYTLASQIKYAKNDLVIIDWDGAFIFDPEGDYASTLELLQLANLQLLRYRILDKRLDERLQHVAKLIRQSSAESRFLFEGADISQTLKDTLLVRSISISEFQAMEREIKLIGDWYWARLYDLITKKFKMEDWRKVVKEKLDAVESVYRLASEKFTLSWERRGRVIELIGWYVLLFGWLVLLVMDFYFYKK